MCSTLTALVSASPRINCASSSNIKHTVLQPVPAPVPAQQHLPQRLALTRVGSLLLLLRRMGMVVNVEADLSMGMSVDAGEGADVDVGVDADVDVEEGGDEGTAGEEGGGHTIVVPATVSRCPTNSMISFPPSSSCTYMCRVVLREPFSCAELCVPPSTCGVPGTAAQCWWETHPKRSLGGAQNDVSTSRHGPMSQPSAPEPWRWEGARPSAPE